MIKKFLLPAIVTSLTQLAGAEPLSPPEGARLVGSKSAVRFKWEGPAGKYYLKVASSGRIFHEGHVQGNSAVVTLSPNMYYTWSVRPALANDSVPTHAFQISSKLNYSFDGAAGKDAVSEAAGGKGQPGQALRIDLTPVGDLVNVKMQGSSRKVEFLLLPDSAPLAVSARGGNGGQGRRGSDGARSGRSPFVNLPTAAQPGYAGGPGGDGGPGGQVVIHSGFPGGVSSILKVNVEGGKAGLGGKGGLRGDHDRLGSQATDGADGPMGQPGIPGRVIEAPP